jgi:hypothetical protein
MMTKTRRAMADSPNALRHQRHVIKHRLLDVERSQLGYQESGDNLTRYGLWYGLNGQPWCGMFQSWCAAKAGLTLIIPKFAYTPAGADWFRNHADFGRTPRVGALAFYDICGLGRISHVGLVEKVFPDGSWYSLEGNTNVLGSREGRVVRRQTRTTLGRLGTFGYPDYTAQARRELAAA